ncbi:MAG TPA: glutaredoxin domain-containing protein [Candidatus Saccharimonadales bacterium]|nr:glutaredoxin domain-containing protein [Candidatus Saccharimonadales bacterium]
MLTWNEFQYYYKLKYGPTPKKVMSYAYTIYKLRNSHVEIFYKPECIYCQKAKELLNHYRIPYTAYDVHNKHHYDMMLKRSHGRKTVPQIFINHKHLGGYDDLSKIL